MKAFDLESWLRAHSTKEERVGAELIFTHSNGETSLLLPRDSWRDNLLPSGSGPLGSFYQEYFGASVGNAQLTFATNVEGGLPVSHGFRLSDFEQMASQARDLGIDLPESELVFLAEAAWMFVYTASMQGGKPVLREYDRDFRTSRVIQSLDEVLEGWWKIAND